VKSGPILSAVRRLLPLLALGAIGALLAGCGGSSGGVPKDAVAVAGGETVSRAQFNRMVHRQQVQFVQQKKAFPKPGTKGYDSIRDQITKYLVLGAEFKQRAADMGISVSDNEVNEGLTKFKQQQFGGDETKYEAARNAQGMTELDVVQSEQLQLLTNKLYKRVTKSATVSDRDLHNYYTANRSQFATRDSRTVRHILVNTKAQADKIYAQLRAGASFAALAKKYSKDTSSAAQGGRLTISRGETVPEFDATAFKLRKNELAKPIKTQFGWHIIQALSPVSKASFTPFAKVRASIKLQLEQAKKNAVMNKWVTGVEKAFCKGHKVKYQTAFVPQVDPCQTAKTTTGSTTPPAATG
jgi:foldase protein PrsA